MRCIACLLGVVILISCTTTTSTSSLGKPASQTDWLTILASEETGPESIIELNRNQSFALCWKDTPNPSNNVPVLKFVVVRMSDRKVVEQGAVTMGTVKWTSDYVVEVAPAPGQVELNRGVNTTIRIIDVKQYLDKVGR